MRESTSQKLLLTAHTTVCVTRIRLDRVIRETVDDMAGRSFGGATMPLRRHLIQQGKISPADIEALRRLVDQLKETNTDG